MNRFSTVILSYIFVSGEEGATVEEIAHHTGFSPQLVGESLAGLRKERHVTVTDETRDCGLLPASPVWKIAA